MKVNWQPKALKQLKKLKDRRAILQITQATGQLSNFPDVNNIKVLNNHIYDYRLRVGHYRILFNLHSAIEVISIEEVKKRDERTY